MINENYKKRLQQLAGLLKENASIGPDGTLYNFTTKGKFIPGDTKLKFSVTYQEVDPGDGEEEVNDFSDQGFEIEPTIAPLSEIVNQAVRQYYTSEPSSTHVGGNTWWSSHPDTDYGTGVEKTYSLHIKHANDLPLSDVEAMFINSLIKNQMEWEEPYEGAPGEWR